MTRFNSMQAFVPDIAHVDAPTGSRYRKVLAKSLPYPHKCTGCGSIDRDCVDLDFQLADDRIQRGRIGAVLLCTQCFRNVADVMGYIPVELAELNVVAAVDQVLKEDAQRKLAELDNAARTLVEDIEARIDVFDVLRTGIFTGGIHSDGSLEIEMDMEPPQGSGMDSEELRRITDPEERAKAIIFGSSSNTNVPNGTERQADKSPVGEGPIIVPAASKLYPKPESL